MSEEHKFVSNYCVKFVEEHFRKLNHQQKTVDYKVLTKKQLIHELSTEIYMIEWFFIYVVCEMQELLEYDDDEWSVYNVNDKFIKVIFHNHKEDIYQFVNKVEKQITIIVYE